MIYMKKIILTGLIFAICGAAQAEITRQTYFNDDIPANAGSYNYGAQKIGNEYHASDGNIYRVQGNQVYSSDGYSYTMYGNGTTLQNNSTGRTYQREGDIYKPIY